MAQHWNEFSSSKKWCRKPSCHFLTIYLWSPDTAQKPERHAALIFHNTLSRSPLPIDGLLGLQVSWGSILQYCLIKRMEVGTGTQTVSGLLQQSPKQRILKQRNSGWCLLCPEPWNLNQKGSDKKKNPRFFKKNLKTRVA